MPVTLPLILPALLRRMPLYLGNRWPSVIVLLLCWPNGKVSLGFTAFLLFFLPWDFQLHAIFNKYVALQVFSWSCFQSPLAPLCSAQLLFTNLMCYLFALPGASVAILYKMESNVNLCRSTLKYFSRSRTLLLNVALCLNFPVNLQAIWQRFCPIQFDSNILVIFVRQYCGCLTKV